MAVARIKFTGFRLMEIPDDIANSPFDEDIDDYINKQLDEMDTGEFKGEVEFEDWW